MSAKAHSQFLVSWEEAVGLRDFGRTFFPLCSMILFKPAEFFRQLRLLPSPQPPSRRICKALVFAAVLGYIKLFLDVINVFWLQRLAPIVFPPQERIDISLLLSFTAGSAFFFLRPIIIFAVTLAVVAAAIKLVLGFDKPLYPAILIVSYKSAAELFHAVPFVGGIFALSWSLALLTIGVREAYGANVLRAFLAALVMPSLLLFSVFLAAGPSLSRAVMALYPEAQTHLRKINDLTAYVTTTSIVAAAEAYKKELGFYPPHLEALQKYLAETDVSRRTGGYAYDYRRLDDARFALEARPVAMNESGHFIFYADERGHVRLGGAEGRWIRNLKDMDAELAAVGG